MINQNYIFRDELKKIASAINKKHKVLHKEILKTSEVFENNQLPVFPYEVCFGLFRHIIDAASVTSSLIFFPFLQNIINLGFANQEMSREIIDLLTHVKEIPKFNSQENSSKLQTILMLLVGKHAVNLKNLKYTHSIINILFSLQNSKSKTLWMKTVSTLNQIALLFLNQLKESPTQQKLQQFNQFLLDIQTIAKKQQPQWLVQKPEQFLAMSLLSDLLDQKHIKQNFDQHRQVFNDFVPTIKKNIQKLSNSLIIDFRNHNSKKQPEKHDKAWQLIPQNELIIMMRLCLKLSRLSLQNFEILEETIKIISQKGSSPVKYIGYQSINYLFSSPSWMQKMLVSPSGDLFNFLMTTLFNNAKFILSQYKDKIDLTVEYQIQKSGKLFSGSFVDFNPFELIPVIQLKMIIKNIEQITFTLYSIYNQNYKISMEKALTEFEIVPLEKTFKFCQKTVFQIAKALIPKDMPEDVLQSLLKICQKFINLSGVLNDSMASTAFMKLICKSCLPAEFKNIGHRHVQINKMILNIANCLGNLFSTGCWAIVWKALENYSIYYNRYLLGKQQLQAQRKSDVEILYKSMDSIFTQSNKYQNQYLLKILRSLIEVTYECLQNNFAEENKKIFAFQRIEQVYRLNTFRIPIIWSELSSSLLCITTSKVLYFRLSAMNLLNTLVPLTLHYTKTHPQVLNDKMNKQNYQLMIFQPWVNLADCQFQQIKIQLSIAVNKIIIDYGHILQKGWSSILQIVKKSKDIKSLQAIVQTYLDKIQDNIMKTINIIDEVERSLQDMNQKYLCLTLIWAIGDHCHKNQQNQALRKIYEILLQPQQMFVLGMQARHSSFYIFAQIIVHNCSQKEQNFWQWVFSQITNYYQYAMKKCLEKRQSTNCQQQLKNILTNLIKIYRRLFSVAKQFKSNELVLSELNHFYKLAADMLEFRQSQIYQMILKQVKEILNMKPVESLTSQQFWKFLQSLNQIYFVQNDMRILKCLITYLPVDIYDILTKCLPQIQQRLYIIYHLVQKIFLLRLQAQQKDIKLSQLRIFFQQKIFLQFFKRLHGQVMKIQNPTQFQKNFITLYLDYLIKTNHKLLLYEDYYYLQKFINLLSIIIQKHCQFFDLKDSIEFFKKIMELKFDKNWIKKHSSSKQIPIWYFATQELIKQGYKFNSQNLQIPYQMVYKIFTKIISQTNQLLEKGLVNSYSLQNLPLFYENHLQVLNFITQCYFLNENFDIQQNVIEDICLNIAKMALSNQFDPAQKYKSAYDLLFKISTKRNELQFYSNTNILDRQAIFVKHLFLTIFNSFDRYFSAFKLKKTQSYQETPLKSFQKQINSFKMKQLAVDQNEQQIKYILKKFLFFELVQGIFQSSILEQFLDENSSQVINLNSKALKSSISHLFYFSTYLAKCIRSNNEDIRQIVSEIFQKMGNCLLLLE